MAGLTAAWALSAPECRDRFDVTVFERQWNLGGKGASTRGVHQRIEEHGLHVWLGYYDNAFRLLRECYEELDRPGTDPDTPIKTWRDAMFPATDVGLEERDGDGWRHWVGAFASNDLEPGDPLGPDNGPPNIAELTRRGVQLILDFVHSLPTVGDDPAVLTLTPSADAPTRVDP